MAQNQIQSYNTVQLHRQLFRNKVANRIMVSAAIIVVFLGFVFGGKYIGLEDYSSKVTGLFGGNKASPVQTENGSLPGTSSGTLDGQGGSSGAAPSIDGVGNSGGSGSAPAAGSGNSSAGPTAPAPEPSTAPSSACGNAAIPANACTALLAIEKNGPKNNPHVAMDQAQLSQIPDGSTIVIDKASWSQVNATQANVNFTINIQGQTYNASLAMEDKGGTWAAVNFALR